MTLPVLTAAGGAAWEPRLLAALDADRTSVRVVRRCVDLADLLAVAAAGTGRAALVGARLRGLDRDAVARLVGSGVSVVGVHDADDVDGAADLRALGVVHVVPGDATAEDVAAVVAVAVARSAADNEGTQPLTPSATARPGASPSAADGPGHDAPDRPALGRLVAVWGPTGAPGRTFLAVSLAAELAALHVETLLADADVYGGSVAQVLGLLDEAPGLAAAARLAGTGRLDAPALAREAPLVADGMRVLSGISRPDRWPELRPSAVEQVWSVAREVAAVTVVDCGFCLEQDEELAYDTAAPRRNGVTLATLAAADLVVVVGGGDPVSVHRLVRGLADLRDVVPVPLLRVVVNRVRPGPVGPDPRRQLTEALARYAGVEAVGFVPDDPAAVDAALRHGRPLREAAPRSAARAAVADLAATVGADLGVLTPSPGARSRRARRTRRRGLRTASAPRS